LVDAVTLADRTRELRTLIEAQDRDAAQAIADEVQDMLCEAINRVAARHSALFEQHAKALLREHEILLRLARMFGGHVNMPRPIIVDPFTLQEIPPPKVKQSEVAPAQMRMAKTAVNATRMRPAGRNAA
jgi:hypothetical protein